MAAPLLSDFPGIPSAVRLPGLLGGSWIPGKGGKALPLKAGALSNIPAQSIPYKPIKFKIEFCSQTQTFFPFTAEKGEMDFSS